MDDESKRLGIDMDRLEGAIEQTTAAGDGITLTGWAKLAGSDAPVELFVLHDSAVISSTASEKPLFGFNCSVALEHLTADSAPTLIVASAETGEVLQQTQVEGHSVPLDNRSLLSAIVAHKTAGELRPMGSAWLASANTIQGWAFDLADPERAVEIILEINGEMVAQIEANGPYRPNPQSPPAHVGFQFILEPQHLRKGLNTIVFKSATTGDVLCRDIEINATGRFLGYIDKIVVDGMKCSISGWAVDTARLNTSPDLDIYVLNHLVKSISCSEERLDVQLLFVGTPVVGFKTTFLAQIASPEELSVRWHGSEHDLIGPGSIDRIEPLKKIEIPTNQPVPQIPAVEKIVTLTVDQIDRDALSGWTADLSNVLLPVELSLSLNGAPYSIVPSLNFRGDVKRAIGGDGHRGFRFELNPHLNLVEPLRYSVQVSSGETGRFTRTNGTLDPVYNRALAPPRTVERVPTTLNRDHPLASKVSVIVLNKDGASLLEPFLRTLYKLRLETDIELIILDERSKDDSIGIIEKYMRIPHDRVSIKIVKTDYESGFSRGNNLAFTESTGDVVVFVNNDIEFVEDIFTPIAQACQDSTVGIVGIRLLDKSTQAAWQSSLPTQHAGIHFNLQDRKRAILPFEMRRGGQINGGILDVPAITGAVMACRREVFEELRGFDERFFYGYEDVDICLRADALEHLHNICITKVSAIHARGSTRRLFDATNGKRIANNQIFFERKWGKRLRKKIRDEGFSRPAYWTGKPPLIALAVTEASMSTAAGDYYTALDLGEAIREHFSAQVIFLDRGKWYQTPGVDMIIALLDDFDPSLIEQAGVNLVVVAWARNWFDRWCSRGNMGGFHQVWASSDAAATFMTKELHRPVHVVRLATNPERFETSNEPPRRADVVFTGSYFGVPREIMGQISNLTVKADIGIFGHNWEKVPPMARYAKGPANYQDLSDIYASSKIVLDDSNVATKRWGSVNSRVYDALGSGRLVLTNGATGAEEVFGGRLPVFNSAAGLDTLLDRFLNDEEARAAVAADLQSEVLARHTYRNRAAEIQTLLENDRNLRFSIKIGCPDAKQKDAWGDYHFAKALARALAKLGHTCRIDTVDRHTCALSKTDDCVIALRGLTQYNPQPGQINILWIISHPKVIALSEIESFDHVFVASDLFAKRLQSITNVPVTPLLQATDPALFNRSKLPSHFPRHEMLFVGNSRGVNRPIVADAIKTNLPLAVYGDGWTNTLNESILRGQYIPNEALGSFYAGAGIVLNDHWDDMRAHGFVSNRIFDAAACGARIVSDDVADLPDFLKDAVTTYSAPGNLAHALEAARNVSDEAIHRASEVILEQHTFDRRAQSILETVSTLVGVDA